MSGLVSDLNHSVRTGDARSGHAEFRRQLQGLRYRPGEAPSADGTPGDTDWLVLVDACGPRKLAFQKVGRPTRTAWPEQDVPIQLHLDRTVGTAEELEHHRHRAQELGTELLLDRSDDADEPLYVVADPSGHPFRIVAA
jgi:hypothetical protein